jgi:hypothetical protein
MNSKAVYIFPYYSYHIEELFKNLDRFNKDDVLYLTSTLYFNILENLNGKEDKLDIYCIWNESDRENLPDELKNINYRIVFTDVSNKKIIFEKLSNKEFTSYKNNLIMFSDVIDVKPSDYEQYFNLLNIEDESLVIAKDKENNIAAFGFNNYSNEIMESLLRSNFNYNDFLGRIKSCAHFMHIVNDVLLVRNISDFKQLYVELSQKKSKEYCSQKMHERFTHLFVEYKDLLK